MVTVSTVVMYNVTRQCPKTNLCLEIGEAGAKSNSVTRQCPKTNLCLEIGETGAKSNNVNRQCPKPICAWK